MILPFKYKNICLEEFKTRHIAELQAWVPDLQSRLLWGGSDYAIPDMKGRLKKDLQLARKSRARFLLRVQLLNKQGKVRAAIGHVQIVNLDRRNRSAHLARVLIEPAYRGQGLGVTLVQAVCGLAFQQLHLHRLSLFVFEKNEPALRCYEQAGFQQEGLLRDRTRVGSTYWSSIAMAMLEDECRVP